MQSRVLVGALIAILVYLPNTGLAQEPKSLDPGQRADEFAPVANEAKATFVFDPERRVTIDGVVEVDNWLIAAKEVVFSPGSALVFSERARNLRDEFFIVAETITITGQESPPQITWSKPMSGGQPDRGQASSGNDGGGHGAHGAAGAPGAEGNPGADGATGPSLTLFVKKRQGKRFRYRYRWS
jgi:hypothetical protein